MCGGLVESWNLRDTHMMETLESLCEYVRRVVAGGAEEMTPLRACPPTEKVKHVKSD